MEYLACLYRETCTQEIICAKRTLAVTIVVNQPSFSIQHVSCSQMPSAFKGHVNCLFNTDFTPMYLFSLLPVSFLGSVKSKIT